MTDAYGHEWDAEDDDAHCENCGAWRLSTAAFLQCRPPVKKEPDGDAEYSVFDEE